MIYAEAMNKNYFKVKLKRPVPEHTERMKEIQGARFINRDVGWKVPMDSFDDFEDLFWDEIIYLTPRHEFLGTAPPKAPKFYQKISMTPVPNMKMNLYPFQTFGAHFLAWCAGNYGLAFLTDKMGIGKTPQSIGGALLMIEEGKVNRVLVVVLASLRKQWVTEGIEDFTYESALAVIGDRNKRDKTYQEVIKNNTRFTVISYETLLSDLDQLKKMNFDLVIFDESHKLKNKMGKMNRAAEKLCKPVKSKKYRGIPYAFFLTGTPLMNRIEEIYGLFKIKDRGIFGTYEDFLEDFTRYREVGHSKDIIGYRNLSELRRIIRWYMLRRTENEVKMDLPKIRNSWHYSDRNALQRKLEGLVEDEKLSAESFAAEAKTEQQRERAENARKGVHNIRQAISNHPKLLAMSGSERIKKKYGALVSGKNITCPKYEEFLDIVDEIVDNGDKIVIFSQFKRMLDIMSDTFTKWNVPFVLYHGQMDDDEKEDAKLAFRNDPDVKLFIATEAGSTGLNLQVARYLINYDLPWNPALKDQRDGRIRRLGSNFENVTIINMITENSIDQEKMDIIRDKRRLFDATVENDAGQTAALRKILND